MRYTNILNYFSDKQPQLDTHQKAILKEVFAVFDYLYCLKTKSPLHEFKVIDSDKVYAQFQATDVFDKLDEWSLRQLINNCVNQLTNYYQFRGKRSLMNFLTDVMRAKSVTEARFMVHSLVSSEWSTLRADVLYEFDPFGQYVITRRELSFPTPPHFTFPAYADDNQWVVWYRNIQLSGYFSFVFEKKNDFVRRGIYPLSVLTFIRDYLSKLSQYRWMKENHPCLKDNRFDPLKAIIVDSLVKTDDAFENRVQRRYRQDYFDDLTQLLDKITHEVLDVGEKDEKEENIT